jgi:hypothetical protein
MEDDLFEDGDPFNDPPTLAEELVAAPRPRKGFIVCPLDWAARIRPLLRSTDQLLAALVLYSRCLRQRSRTVDLSNSEFVELRIGRMTKHRTLLLLEEAGVITVERQNGRSPRVTLHWFP